MNFKKKKKKKICHYEDKQPTKFKSFSFLIKKKKKNMFNYFSVVKVFKYV